MKKHIILAIVAVMGFATVRAQFSQYFNLTAEEVRIDRRLPIFNYSFDLGTDYQSAEYSVELTYPQFIDMTKEDIAKLMAIPHDSLPELPVVNGHLSVERKVGKMDVWLLPVVYRDGRYQKMVSFGLSLVRKSPRRAAATRAAGEGRYANNSVLREGRWAKIRVGESGVHQLTPEVIKKAGFSDLARVKVYGYGGALQPEKLTADYLAATDDLKEIATYATAGRKLFMAKALCRGRTTVSACAIHILIMDITSSPKATNRSLPTVPHSWLRSIPMGILTPSKPHMPYMRWTTMHGYTEADTCMTVVKLTMATRMNIH